MAKKITVNKNDEIPSVVERVLDAEGDEITVAIPRFSKLIDSPANFRLLKREGEALGKKILIESVDDRVIEMAKGAGLECVNPFFEGGARPFSDIVTVKKEHAPSRERARASRHHEEKKKEHHTEQAPQHEESPPHAPREARSSRFRRKRRYMVLGAAAVLIGIVLFIGIGVLPRAEIALVSAKTDWSYDGTLLIDRGLSQIDVLQKAIPGARFSEKKNIQLFFPASGKRRVEEKAAGTITVYNAHSSEPQALVKSTRFVTPDGKVFRLVEGITVPGAKIEAGKIVPSSIDAKVAADKAGSQYNIPATPKFSIPGFSGTAKAETFYGGSSAAMSGGFVGEVAYPSDSDLKTAKATIAETLHKSMRELMLATLPKDFSIPEGGEVFTLLDSRVDSGASTEGKFALFAEGELSILMFRETDIVALFTEQVQQETGTDFVVKDYSVSYKKGTATAQGTFSLPVTYEAFLARAIDIEAVKEEVAGEHEDKLRSLIFSPSRVESIESARISLWPFWVRRVPRDMEKIRILVDAAPEGVS